MTITTQLVSLVTLLTTSVILTRKEQSIFQSFFSGLRGYDSHLIMRGIHSGKKPTKEKMAESKCKNIRVIANNMERYVSFQLGNLRFLDSLQFFGLGSSLDSLASN